MPRIGEKLSCELTWQQELGVEPINPSTHDWFQSEIDGLVQAVVKLDRVTEDYCVKRIMSAVDQLESSRLEVLELKRKLTEFEDKVRAFAKDCGIHPGRN